jgi:hypothetical protein
MVKHNASGRAAKRPRTGPDARLLSIYASKAEAKIMKERAASLKISLSKYLCLLADRDIKEGRPFTLG